VPGVQFSAKICHRGRFWSFLSIFSSIHTQIGVSDQKELVKIANQD
jgi:hypothetical protein